MASRTLSTPQRIAIRNIADGDWDAVPPRTLRSLHKAGLVTHCPSTALTARGRRAHEQIMASGDGPEDLKAMFGPLIRGVRL